jgi:hypothetical protein
MLAVLQTLFKFDEVYAYDENKDENLIALPTYFSGPSVSDEGLCSWLDNQVAPYV